MAARYDSWGGFKECLEIRKGHIRGLKEELCGPLTQAGPKDPMWLCRGGGGGGVLGLLSGRKHVFTAGGGSLGRELDSCCFYC